MKNIKEKILFSVLVFVFVFHYSFQFAKAEYIQEKSCSADCHHESIPEDICQELSLGQILTNPASCNLPDFSNLYGKDFLYQKDILDPELLHLSSKLSHQELARSHLRFDR